MEYIGNLQGNTTHVGPWAWAWAHGPGPGAAAGPSGPVPLRRPPNVFDAVIIKKL